MADYTEKLTDAQAMGFIDQVGSAFKSLPHLPPSVVDILVKLAPYGALIGGVLCLLVGPFALLGSFVSIFTLNPVLMVSILGNAIILIIQAFLLLTAFGPLKNREAKGWILLFWSQVLSIATMVFSVLLGHSSSIVGSILGLVIGMYILFETRDSYKGVVSKVAEKVKEISSK